MLALLFCILCCKWRVLANYCLYFECVIRTCAWFVPNSNSEKLNVSNLTTLSVIYFLSFYCDQSSQLIFVSVHLAIEIFFGVHFAYREPLSAMLLSLNIAHILIFFLCTMIVAMMVVYIEQL